MLRIVAYEPAYAAVFDRLNREWIEEYFTVEPFDDQVLRNPEPMIIAPGGELWFGEFDGEVVGACALLPYGDGNFEFTKLGVDKKSRGRGVARALLGHCIARARELAATRVVIFTSSRLNPANALYRSIGFVEKPMTAEQCTRYRRADIYYELKL